MSRYCETCGSNNPVMPQVSPGYWRKECAICGSTGPFLPEPPTNPVDVTTTPWLHKRTDRQLQAGVEQFTLDGPNHQKETPMSRKPRTHLKPSILIIIALHGR